MSNVRTVLFVDDDPAFLEAVSEAMRQASGDDWNILTADLPSKVLGLLKEHPVRLLVVDARMPVMDGLQLIHLVRPRYPQIVIVLLSAFADNATKELCIREGADVCLEKPKSAEAYQSLYLTLGELLSMERQQGFRGLLHQIELEDILQLQCLRRHSSVLEVFTRTESGTIVLQNGAIVHAETGTLSGPEAFFHLLTLPGGEFRLKPFVAPTECTIAQSWELLLMEASRTRDELISREVEMPGRPGPTPVPRIEVDDAERVLPHPTRVLRAVSIEGDLLTEFGSTDLLADAHSLADAAREAAMLGETSFGSPESFSAAAGESEIIICFEPEAAVAVVVPREIALS